MSNAPGELHPAIPLPSRIGQATAVEQSRAVAEVQAAVLVAQQVPRSIGVARTAMIESCQMLGLAERAFYRYNRGGTVVAGPSVHLARELARCWGNVQYGIVELRRDDDHAQSEMMAWAWDVQMNTRSSNTFIVPHMRDKKGGPERLVDLRDIYESNANMGARRLREAIFSILPPWFTEEAKELCTKTIERGDGKPLPDRVEGAIRAFERIGVTAERLEQKVGRTSDRWTQFDIAQLVVTHRSIERGEVAVEDEFPQRRVTVAEVTAAPTAAPAAPAASGDVTPEQRAAAARLAELEAKAAADAGGWITDDEIAAQQADTSAPTATTLPENPEGAGPDSPTPSTTSRRKAP